MIVFLFIVNIINGDYMKTIIDICIILIPIFFFSCLCFPFVKFITKHINAYDIPNKRKVHKNKMLLSGGLIIYFGFLLGFMLFIPKNNMMFSILVGSFIVIIIGILDDIKPLNAKSKILGQFIVSFIIVFYGKILLSEIHIFNIYINLGLLSYPITMLFIVSLMNSINFIDGLDGLAGGISLIFFITIFFIGLLMNNLASTEITLCLIMIASVLGFLMFNFYPAKIFMGEVGSMFLGYMIGVICLLGYKTVTLTSFVVPLIILAIPILDTLFAIIRRLIRGNCFYEADKKHFHHQLLNKKFSHKLTVIIIYMINLLFSLVSIFYIFKDRLVGFVIYIFLCLFIIWLVVTTDIVVSYENKGV